MYFCQFVLFSQHIEFSGHLVHLCILVFANTTQKQRNPSVWLSILISVPERHLACVIAPSSIWLRICQVQIIYVKLYAHLGFTAHKLPCSAYIYTHYLRKQFLNNMSARKFSSLSRTKKASIYSEHFARPITVLHLPYRPRALQETFLSTFSDSSVVPYTSNVPSTLIQNFQATVSLIAHRAIMMSYMYA